MITRSVAKSESDKCALLMNRIVKESIRFDVTNDKLPKRMCTEYVKVLVKVKVEVTVVIVTVIIVTVAVEI